MKSFEEELKEETMRVWRAKDEASSNLAHKIVHSIQPELRQEDYDYLKAHEAIAEAIRDYLL